MGLILVYTADRKWLHFETAAPLWGQIVKAVGGLGLVIAAKELLRFPLDAILPENTYARMVRYFLMVVIGGILWPMTFRFFSKFSKNKEVTTDAI